MRSFAIPERLVQLVSERRIIPFIGSGFSAALGLPTWDELLSKVAEDLECGVPYDEIRKSCQGDPLQVAEYLYLTADERIGPLRHSMASQLAAPSAVTRSGAHIELTNLGAPQVYTTNFDELIERTYRALGHGVEVVALPEDVARSHGHATEVVKYHGDLRHDETLVLTESQYYTRLDFESPMDLKFRSDLLGRAVLFMGYSFRDINIRIIWFKLMRMMKDVPMRDRPLSYITRFEPNDVLEKLYQTVGLQTIVLDPERGADTREKRTQLLADFMLTLATRADRAGVIPGSASPMAVSVTLLRALGDELKLVDDPRVRSRTILSPTLGLLLEHLAARRVPEDIAEPTRKAFERVARFGPPVQLVVRLGLAHLQQLGPGTAATLLIANSLLTSVSRWSILMSTEIQWPDVWQPVLVEEDARSILRRAEVEVEGHEEADYTDDDVAYAVDLIARIARRQIIAPDVSDDVVETAKALITRVAGLYPAAGTYEPDPLGPPAVRAIQEEIEEQHPDEEEEELEEEQEEEDESEDGEDAVLA